MHAHLCTLAHTQTMAILQAGRGWHTPLIPALRKQRQTDFCDFEASLVYRVPGQPELHRETLSRKTKKRWQYSHLIN